MQGGREDAQAEEAVFEKPGGERPGLFSKGCVCTWARRTCSTLEERNKVEEVTEARSCWAL